jgi:ABC-type iron transport system FetAB ATPase subunit
MLRALADLDPHHGEVALDGMTQQQVPPPQWRQQVALLPAESRWWADSVGEHFVGDTPADWLQCLGFDATVWDWEIKRLSSGEKQRLGLLRVLSLTPKVLLLDEPSANLDGENVGKIEEILHRYREEHAAALLWVSHDPKQIERIADRHGRFEDGQLVWQ